MSRLVFMSAFIALAIGCGGGDSSPTPAPSQTPSPSGGSAITIPIGASTLGRAAYNPADLAVSVGTSVTWTNADVVSHTSTADANGWNSAVIAPGGQFSFVFPTAGTFSYHCAIHPGMVGNVVVR